MALTRDEAFLLVADSGNDRVAVLRASDGSWVRALTGPPDTLLTPCGVAVAPSGEVLFTDTRQHVVVRFRSIEDDTVPVVGTLGTGRGDGLTELGNPFGFALVDDHQVHSIFSVN